MLSKYPYKSDNVKNKNSLEHALLVELENGYDDCFTTEEIKEALEKVIMKFTQ